LNSFHDRAVGGAFCHDDSGKVNSAKHGDRIASNWWHDRMSFPALALVGGRLFPPVSGEADSLLVQNGTIRLVGAEAEVRAAAGGAAEIVELGGRRIAPAYHDAHFHFLEAGLVQARPSLEACRSLADLADAVADADRSSDGSILFFEGWDQNDWAEPRLPTRALLDEAGGGRPVVASRVCGHVAVASSKALEAIGTRWAGGGIDAETGVLLEEPALRLEEMFPPNADEVDRALDEAERVCLRLGITTACDFLRPFAARAYRERLARRDLTVRVNAYVFEDCLDDPDLAASLPASEHFRVRGLKLFADGSVGGRTAAVFADYADRPGERGTLMFDDAGLEASVRRGHDAGFAVAVHAIGDRAIAQVLAAFAKLPPDEIRARRHRIEHFEMARPEDIRRAADLGVRPCMQPNFVRRWGQPGGMYEVALGPARTRRMNAFRSALDAGTGVFFGSDGMPPSPRFGIRAAVDHPVESERVDEADAHRLYSEAGAEAVRGDRHSGRIAPGTDADLAVLSSDPGADEVDLTIVGGRVVRRAGSP
jgi:predicted amidohydrolase YtcJ